MVNLPSPMTPPDCDLRGYDYMPLFGQKLFGSTLYTDSTDLEYRVATKLWWEAWTQCPAGSLPNNDKALARFADFGTDIKGWLKVKAMALHGFVLCDDGRLYHPMLCEAAVKAFALRLKNDAKRKADRERLQAWREERRKQASSPGGNDNSTAPETPVETSDVTPPETPDETRFETPPVARRMERNGKEVRKKEPPSLRETPPSRKNGTRLPADWCPNETDCAFAIALGLGPDQVAAKFRDYWAGRAGQGGIKLDWSATWRNWCREDAERRRKPAETEGYFDRAVRLERAEREAARRQRADSVVILQ